ncbi:hypothetical protein STSP2_00091 [Anaerohalosphaera lusitana]|uniref:Uncharacterized protein n=1 Tax=Anaerohalosphaera lusitana TaxID=1936003 RepID=A0A1U9NGA1_9BACT|nr:hypothetical protein [Anaerohalosphaera lusitana]AQT66953.1 hypothetical protein STSP2_00091 [Anaerohalosphaera lusitana]
MGTTGWVVLGVVNIPIYVGLGWVFFRDWDGFWEAIRFWLTPDVFSMFTGEFFDDWWAESKLAAWVILCGACVIGEGLLINTMFG